MKQSQRVHRLSSAWISMRALWQWQHAFPCHLLHRALGQHALCSSACVFLTEDVQVSARQRDAPDTLCATLSQWLPGHRQGFPAHWQDRGQRVCCIRRLPAAFRKTGALCCAALSVWQRVCFLAHSSKLKSCCSRDGVFHVKQCRCTRLRPARAACVCPVATYVPAPAPFTEHWSSTLLGLQCLCLPHAGHAAGRATQRRSSHTERSPSHRQGTNKGFQLTGRTEDKDSCCTCRSRTAFRKAESLCRAAQYEYTRV